VAAGIHLPAHAHPLLIAGRFSIDGVALGMIGRSQHAAMRGSRRQSCFPLH